MTKCIVAAAVMQLLEALYKELSESLERACRKAEKLSLEDELAHHLPCFRDLKVLSKGEAERIHVGGHRGS